MHTIVGELKMRGMRDGFGRFFLMGALLTGVLFLVSACGSSGSSGSNPSASTGTFTDAPVKGLKYQDSPSGLSGVTDSNGHFNYMPDDTVTFSIGSISLPAVKATAEITPVSVFGADYSDPRVQNLAVFLQSLNSDVSTVPADMTSGMTVAVFSSTADTDSLINKAGVTTPISNSAAIAGLINGTSLGGTSYAGTDSSGKHIVVTFLNNGTYFFGEDGPTDSDGKGYSGYEYGTYSWSPATHVISATVLKDTNGDWAFSNTVGTTYAFVNGSSDTLTMGDSQDTFQGVGALVTADPSNPILGSWLLTGVSGGPQYWPQVVTLLSDGTYYAVEEGSGQGNYGYERGTYQWNQSTGKYTCQVLVSTDSAQSCPNIYGDTTGAYTITVSGNTLTSTDFNGTYTWTRVTPQ